MEGLRPVEVLGMIVENIHVLQFLRDDDFLLQKSPDQPISEGSQGRSDVLAHFQVNHCHFLAFGVLVESREVVDPCEFKRVFGEDPVDVLLEVGEEG